MIFGKLPSHGDFVVRGLSASQQVELDRWLSSSMAEARERLGELFERSFDATLPWRFAWHEEGWTAGAMAPSVDSAGRRFPVIAGLRGLDASLASDACEQCEESLFEAVSNRWSVDELAAQLSSTSISAGSSEVKEGWWAADADVKQLPERFPPAILTQMVEASIGTGV